MRTNETTSHTRTARVALTGTPKKIMTLRVRAVVTSLTTYPERIRR